MKRETVIFSNQLHYKAAIPSHFESCDPIWYETLTVDERQTNSFKGKIFV